MAVLLTEPKIMSHVLPDSDCKNKINMKMCYTAKAHIGNVDRFVCLHGFSYEVVCI